MWKGDGIEQQPSNSYKFISSLQFSETEHHLEPSEGQPMKNQHSTVSSQMPMTSRVESRLATRSKHQATTAHRTHSSEHPILLEKLRFQMEECHSLDDSRWHCSIPSRPMRRNIRVTKIDIRIDPRYPAPILHSRLSFKVLIST